MLARRGPRLAFAACVAGPKVGWVADRIAGSSFDGHPVRAWSLEPGPDRLTFEGAGLDDGPVDLDDARRTLLALGDEGRPVTVRMDGPPRRHILVETGPVAGFGWTGLRRGGSGAVEPSAPVVRVFSASAPSTPI